MNIDKETITTNLNKLLAYVQRHALVLGVAAFGLLYGYIIMQVGSMVNKVPDQSQVTEQLKAVPRPKIDKEVAKTIEGLESQNVNVQAIFNEARDNPFSE